MMEEVTGGASFGDHCVKRSIKKTIHDDSLEASLTGYGV